MDHSHHGTRPFSCISLQTCFPVTSVAKRFGTHFRIAQTIRNFEEPDYNRELRIDSLTETDTVPPGGRRLGDAATVLAQDLQKETAASGWWQFPRRAILGDEPRPQACGRGCGWRKGSPGHCAPIARCFEAPPATRSTPGWDAAASNPISKRNSNSKICTNRLHAADFRTNYLPMNHLVCPGLGASSGG
jgi:hypothetical protein